MATDAYVGRRRRPAAQRRAPCQRGGLRSWCRAEPGGASDAGRDAAALAGACAPRPGQILVADVPIFALELCATTLLLAAAALAGDGTWWVAAAALALAAAVLLGARVVPERLAHRPVVRGLAVLADRRRRGWLIAVVAAIATLTTARLWLVLWTCGLPHGLAEIASVFATLGVFGLLPIGPGASPGATVAAIGATQVGDAIAAGLVLGGSSIIAVLVYGLCVACASTLVHTGALVRRSTLVRPSGYAGSSARARAQRVPR